MSIDTQVIVNYHFQLILSGLHEVHLRLLHQCQDLLALKEEYTTRPAKEETINDPTNPKHYWRFRKHVFIIHVWWKRKKKKKKNFKAIVSVSLQSAYNVSCLENHRFLSVMFFR